MRRATFTIMVLLQSAVLQSKGSPIAEKPLVTPTPFPASSMTAPKHLSEKNATTPTLNSFLAPEGFGVVKLKQKNFDIDPKRLVIDVAINRVSATLEVDTGAGGIVIARASLKKFGLVEQKIPIRISIFGKKSALNPFWSVAKLDSLVIGDSAIHAVPVGIKEIPHLDGLLGSPEMHSVGAVLDCVEPALYLPRRGFSSRTSEQLAAVLQTNGFTQVPLRLNSDHHLEVDCSIDGVSSTMLVDTGSRFTLIGESIGTKAGIMMTRSTTEGTAWEGTPLSRGRVKKLGIGDFQIRDTDVYFVDLKKADHPSTYVLGIRELVSSFAVIDIGGLRMYLRHPQ